jgi:hypothetical protein
MVNAETRAAAGADLTASSNNAWLPSSSRPARAPPNKEPAPKNVTFNRHPTWETPTTIITTECTRICLTYKVPTNHPTGVNHQMAWETLTHAEAGCRASPAGK